MKFTRRDFMKRAAIAGAGVALLPRIAWPFSQSPVGISKFVTGLPGLGPTGANELGNYISVLKPNTAEEFGTDFYEIVAKQYSQTIYHHGGLSISPKFWGYADKATGKSTYLGGLIVARRGRTVKIRAENSLPTAHILPVDLTQIDANEPKDRFDRIAIHLHGGLVQWENDGGPYAWYTNHKNPGGFVHGSSLMNGLGKSGAALYEYPNN
jgi:FtsP/CotA-like multicopper oxidase with cupredoxin domain